MFTGSAESDTSCLTFNGPFKHIVLSSRKSGIGWRIMEFKTLKLSFTVSLRIFKEIKIKSSCLAKEPNSKQECIPVGCVPAARCPYAEVCFPGGVCSRGGGCLLRGGCLLVGICSGGTALGGLLWGGVSAPRGVLLPRGVCSQGVYPSMHWGRHPPSGKTDACENITLAQLHCGR